MSGRNLGSELRDLAAAMRAATDSSEFHPSLGRRKIYKLQMGYRCPWHRSPRSASDTDVVEGLSRGGTVCGGQGAFSGTLCVLTSF